mmetsp:Transcript_19235/g.32965  ORF Transcript_19235/g.32965 Transcript_19235/m.32965 type:complete len:96 (-) Transcript_19235:45-332(-)
MTSPSFYHQKFFDRCHSRKPWIQMVAGFNHKLRHPARLLALFPSLEPESDQEFYCVECCRASVFPGGVFKVLDMLAESVLSPTWKLHNWHESGNC